MRISINYDDCCFIAIWLLKCNCSCLACGLRLYKSTYLQNRNGKIMEGCAPPKDKPNCNRRLWRTTTEWVPTKWALSAMLLAFFSRVLVVSLPKACEARWNVSNFGVQSTHPATSELWLQKCWLRLRHYPSSMIKPFSWWRSLSTGLTVTIVHWAELKSLKVVPLTTHKPQCRRGEIDKVYADWKIHMTIVYSLYRYSTWITHNHILTLYYTHCVIRIPIFTSHHIPYIPSTHLVVSLRFGLSSRGLRFHGLQLCTWPEVNNNNHNNHNHNTFHIPRCMILQRSPKSGRVAIQLPTCHHLSYLPRPILGICNEFLQHEHHTVAASLGRQINTNGWSLFGDYNYFKFESPVRIEN